MRRRLRLDRLESRRLLAAGPPVAHVPPLDPGVVLVGRIDLDPASPGSEVVIADGVPAGVPIDALGTLTTEGDAVLDGLVEYAAPGVEFFAFNVQYVSPWTGELTDAQGASLTTHNVPYAVPGVSLVEFPPSPVLSLSLYVTADVDGDGAIDVIVGDDVPAGTIFIDSAGEIQTTTHWDTAHGIEGFVSHFSYHRESNRFVNLLAYDPDGPGGGDAILWANNVDGAFASEYGLF